MGSGRPNGSGFMGQTKVRCRFCGAKNADDKTERCRICGGVLPDAAERRKRTTEGAAFATLVEGELDRWRLYSESA
jgi:ribosomal protein L37E